MSTFSLYIYIFIYRVCKYKCMQADATVAPTCIDIIYILHVYLSLCVITIYCKCVSTNKYCLLSIVNPWDDWNRNFTYFCVLFGVYCTVVQCKDALSIYCCSPMEYGPYLLTEWCLLSGLNLNIDCLPSADQPQKICAVFKFFYFLFLKFSFWSVPCFSKVPVSCIFGILVYSI